MHLAECRYLGFLHLWFKQQLSASSPGVANKVEITSQESVDGVTTSFILPNKEEILLLLDQGNSLSLDARHLSLGFPHPMENKHEHDIVMIGYKSR